MNLVPVDHDPFAAAPQIKLTPVEHNPFEAAVPDAGAVDLPTEAGMIVPELPRDPALEAYREQVSPTQRILNDLKIGVAQARQTPSVLGADIAGRQAQTFETARSTDPGAPNAPMGGMVRAMRQQSPEQADQTRTSLRDSLGQAVQGIVRQRGIIESLPQNPAVKDMLASKSFGEALGHFWRDPVGSIAALGVQSAPSMVPAIGAALLTGPAGGAAVMGLTSGMQEYAGSILEELGKAGVDVRDPAQLSAAFRNPELTGAIREKAIKRAAIVGALDAATMGVAGKTLAPRGLTSTLARQAVNVPAQMGVQVAGGAGGETAAQLATEGRITDPGQIVAEGVGELFGAPADVAALAGHRALAARTPRLTPVDHNPFAGERIEPTLSIPEPTLQPGDVVVGFPPEGPQDSTAAPPVSPGPAPAPEPPPIQAAPTATQTTPEPVPDAGPVILPPDSLQPSDRTHGEPDQLGTRVPRTQAVAEGMLDRADEKRFTPIPTPELRLAARQRQSEAIAQLSQLEQEARANPSTSEDPKTVDFILTTARGKEARFRLIKDPDVIADFRERLLGPKEEDKFYSRTPDTDRAMQAIERGLGLSETQVQNELPDTAMAVTPGKNYTGFVRTAFDPLKPAGLKDPIRREKIIADLTKALDTALYEGRIKGKGTLGFYRKRIEEVRTKFANDLETGSHEIAHLLDDRIPAIRAQWLPATNANKVVREELAGVSYDKGKIYEGFAEFVRLWATQPDRAAALAPTFHAWFESFVANDKEYGPPLRKAQQDMTGWFNQAALDRARSKIGVIEEAVRGKLGDRINQSLFDDLYGIKAMEQSLAGAVSGAGPYVTGRLLRGATAIIDGTLTLGAIKVRPDGSHYFAGKSLSDILKPVRRDIEGFKMYAVGRSAQELYGQGRENLFKPDEIKAMLALETPAFKQAFEEFQGWNNALLDFAEVKGIINPDTRRLWKRAAYLPFHRVSSGGPGKGFTRVSGQFAGIKSLLGGTENIHDPLQNILRNAQVLIRAALANEVRQKVATLAKQAGGAKFMAQIPTEEFSVKVHQDEIKRAMLEALGVKSELALDPDQQIVIDQIVDGLSPMVDLIMRGQSPTGSNVLAVLNDGKPTYFEVADDLLMRALLALERKPAGALLKLMNTGRSLMQKSITADPDFIIKNFVRDQVSATALSRSRYIPLATAMSGLKSRITKDQSYRDYLANGGAIAGMAFDDADLQAKLEGIYVKAGINPRTVVNSWKKGWAALGEVLSALEVATRLGEFKKAVARGDNPRTAAFEAREVSTDFSMRGDSQSAAFAYDSMMFLLATVNGMARLARGVRDPRTRNTVLGVVTALTAMSVGLHLQNMGTPEYEELSDFDKDTFYHFIFRKRDGSIAHWRFPKVWELSMPGTVAERIMDAHRNQWDARSFRRIAQAFGTAFGLNFVPAVVQPIVESFANTRMFGGTPIESQGMENREKWARFSGNTSETMRRLGEATRDLPESLQISPAKAEHLVRAYTNAFGLWGLRISDRAFFGDTAPELRNDQLPIIKTFSPERPTPHSQYVSDLYEMIRESDRTVTTMRLMDRFGRPEIADERTGTPGIAFRRQLNAAEKRMQAVNKDRLMVRNTNDLAALQRFATERARIQNKPALVQQLQTAGAWNRVPAMKSALEADLLREVNAFAAQRAPELRQQRRELRQGAQ